MYIFESDSLERSRVNHDDDFLLLRQYKQRNEAKLSQKNKKKSRASFFAFLWVRPGILSPFDLTLERGRFFSDIESLRKKQMTRKKKSWARGWELIIDFQSEFALLGHPNADLLHDVTLRMGPITSFDKLLTLKASLAILFPSIILQRGGKTENDHPLINCHRLLRKSSNSNPYHYCLTEVVFRIKEIKPAWSLDKNCTSRMFRLARVTFVSVISFPCIEKTL